MEPIFLTAITQFPETGRAKYVATPEIQIVKAPAAKYEGKHGVVNEGPTAEALEDLETMRRGRKVLRVSPTVYLFVG